MATQNLPVQSKAASIRNLFEKSRKQMEMALPKHLTADRLLRVAMTSIQRTPKLLECTQQSLLACVMTCAQLGLEPDQFLGQAYLIPYGKTCTLIPGYRGYIALARRSGELQTLSAQVVYSKDYFELQYGVEDTLTHKPALNDRGEPIGAYCVFKYKDGGYSFDWMSKEDIEKIRKRSKAANEGPWVTDWDEMAKKTVIRRHVKLAPMSIEFQTAVALEERAMAGESQDDLLSGMDDDGVIDADEGTAEDLEALLKSFEDSIPEGTDLKVLDGFIASVAKANKSDAVGVKMEAAKQLTSFWKAFNQYEAKELNKRATKDATEPKTKPEHEERFSCPQGGFTTASLCKACEHLVDKQGERCPNAPA